MKKINDEVYYTENALARVGKDEIAFVKQHAFKNARQRCRLCMHLSPDDLLHEMLIALCKQSYIRPHKHQNKAESLHIIDGEVDLVFFNDEGEITEILSMGDYRSGKLFFCRISEPWYHTFLLRTEMLIFHETTTGPFIRPQTVFAPWAPEEGDVQATQEYVERVEKQVSTFLAR